jgi:hypothetical protein
MGFGVWRDGQIIKVAIVMAVLSPHQAGLFQFVNRPPYCLFIHASKQRQQVESREGN